MAGEEIVIRRGREPVAMLVRAPGPAGRRQIWADLDGAMADDFDELPGGLRAVRVRGLLVDTNVIVWLLLGDRSRVSETARLTLEDERNSVVVSAATVWEIAVKRSAGLTIEDGWSRLPWHRRDPFDRLLVAQAMSEGSQARERRCPPCRVRGRPPLVS